jgi:hypothetical protein
MMKNVNVNVNVNVRLHNPGDLLLLLVARRKGREEIDKYEVVGKNKL